MNKIKKILSWHIRKDLSLRSKWWHRLFLLVYAISTFFIFGALVNSGDLNILDYPQYRMVNTVENRIDSKLNTLKNLTNSNERIGDVGASSYSFKVSKSESLFNNEFSRNIYCSTEINSHIKTILNDKKIEHLFVGGKEVLLEIFLNNINKNNITCVLIDSYSNTHGTSMYFLRTDKDFYYENGFGKGLGFYEISTPKTVLFAVLDLFFILFITLMISYFISVLYHKIILYVIFGKNK